MERAYIYTRVSTEMQVDGFSLAAQKEDICKYAKLRGIQIVGEFCDEGKSGKSDKRPEFMKMIETIKTNKDNVRYVLVFKLSRFARNAADTLKNLQLMQDNGVDLICIKEGLDSSTATGKLMVTVMSAVAEMELDNIHTQTMAGRKQKAKEGKWNGGFAPYGYKLENGALVVVDEEAKTVRYIYELFVNENLGAMGVAKRLNAEGIKKVVRQNGKYDIFTADFVKDILDNPVYKGKIAYGRRKTKKVNGEHGKTRVVKETDESNIILVDGVHTALVSEELWEKAHSKRLDTGVRKEKLEQDHQYILSGLIKCPSCGTPMYGVPNRKKKKDGTYYSISYAYKCRNHGNARGVQCSFARQFNCREIDAEFYRSLGLCLLTPNIINEVLEKINKEFDMSELESKLKELQSRKRELEGIRKKYEQAQRALDIEDKHYDRKFENYARQLDELYDQLDEVDALTYSTQSKINNAIATKKSKEDAVRLIMHFALNFDLLSSYAQKTYANMMVDSIEIFPTKKDMGYLKSIRFKIPVIKNNGELTNLMTINDYFPDILDENGNFNGFEPITDTRNGMDMLAERADEDGNIVVVDESEIQDDWGEMLKLRIEQVNRIRRLKGLPELTIEEYFTNCRPNQITDECVVCLSREKADDYVRISVHTKDLKAPQEQ